MVTETQDKVSRFLNNLVTLKTIDFNEARTLRPVGSSPDIHHWLPNIHKLTVDLRQIIAAIHKLSKFLIPFFSNFTLNEYTARNSYDLSQYLSVYSLPESYFMVSYDVTSLFRNITRNESIDMCAKEDFSGIEKFLGMTKQMFKNVLFVCVQDKNFLFSGELYKQTEGVAMGSPLGPTFAYLFFSFHTKNWLSNYIDFLN